MRISKMVAAIAGLVMSSAAISANITPTSGTWGNYNVLSTGPYSNNYVQNTYLVKLQPVGTSDYFYIRADNKDFFAASLVAMTNNQVARVFLVKDLSNGHWSDYKIQTQFVCIDESSC